MCEMGGLSRALLLSVDRPGRSSFDRSEGQRALDLIRPIPTLQARRSKMIVHRAGRKRRSQCSGRSCPVPVVSDRSSRFLSEPTVILYSSVLTQLYRVSQVKIGN
ncbi:hypothetical protein BS78_01G110400 [Paspalum vaginatum]|nr:hypothetical protein BS78_01G110400 [Paspalum vaginatum]